jgi:opacity protein-like surface antigen
MGSSFGNGVRAALMGSVWLTGAAMLAVLPLALTATPAAAQDDGGEGGHEDGGEGGGHEDGGDEGGGHEDGGDEGGHGGGQGGHGNGHDMPEAAPAAGLFTGGSGDEAVAVSGVSREGGYIRGELGGTRYSAGDASWLPPGYPEDPKVFFNLDTDDAVFGALAFGYDYGNGWRAEVAINMFGSSDFDGDWSRTEPADPGPHASMEGSVKSLAMFANGYYDIPTEGSVTPFLTAGLGVARNSMDDWTRINPDSDRTTRSYEGGSESSLAWSIGAGLAVEIGPIVGSQPAQLELAWRYFDLGSVSGGTAPLPGSGESGEPQAPLGFDVTNQVISVGLRIPLD